ncbi:inositol monophosphatase [Candidatus Acetothermia bacterium]|nr:inositol monophosphatase [Candidatus Acetothermia bacterium]MBI3642938.1 inositol monophosphatase [Candidatus Acetothermia bacterium]
MPKTKSLDQYLHFTTALAKETGALLREMLAQNVSYSLKSSHQDLVTAADRAAEELIVKKIKDKYPEHGILSEESAELKSESNFRWVIDPVDGTSNFAHGIPFFCTSIALEEDGRLVAGAIYEPLRDELFSVALGEGAWLNGQPLNVSSPDQVKKAILAVGYPYDFSLLDGYVAQMKLFLPVAQGLRRLGSAALSLAYIAAGRLDGYVDMNLNRWDLAAGVLLVTEAGGQVTGFQGTELELDTRAIMASNGKIHDEMLKMLEV